jgi:hypothetical protein
MHSHNNYVHVASAVLQNIKEEVPETITVKAEPLSGSEAVEEKMDPQQIMVPGIKSEPEVRCIPASILEGFHKYKHPSFYQHFIYINFFCYKSGKCICIIGVQVERNLTCSNHTETDVLLMFILYIYIICVHHGFLTEGMFCSWMVLILARTVEAS